MQCKASRLIERKRYNKGFLLFSLLPFFPRSRSRSRCSLLREHIPSLYSFLWTDSLIGWCTISILTEFSGLSFPTEQCFKCVCFPVQCVPFPPTPHLQLGKSQHASPFPLFPGTHTGPMSLGSCKSPGRRRVQELGGSSQGSCVQIQWVGSKKLTPTFNQKTLNQQLLIQLHK